MPHRYLLEDTTAGSGAGGAVVFPDDYPNSVKHVLLIGSLAFLAGTIVFVYLLMSRKQATISHSLLFLCSAVASMSYYSLWNGLGVEYKTTDITPRVILWSRHLDQLITVPVILANLCVIAKSDASIYVAVISNGVLYVISSMVGAATVAPVKYMWWFASAIFAVLVIIHLSQRIPEGSHEVHKNLTYLTIASLVVYSILWLVGSEGTAALGLSQEVAILTFVDLITKVGFGLYFLFNYEAVMEEGEPGQESQQYV